MHDYLQIVINFEQMVAELQNCKDINQFIHIFQLAQTFRSDREFLICHQQNRQQISRSEKLAQLVITYLQVQPNDKPRSSSFAVSISFDCQSSPSHTTTRVRDKICALVRLCLDLDINLFVFLSPLPHTIFKLSPTKTRILPVVKYTYSKGDAAASFVHGWFTFSLSLAPDLYFVCCDF